MSKLRFFSLLIVIGTSSLANIPTVHAQSNVFSSLEEDSSRNALRNENALENDATVKFVSGSSNSSWFPEWSMPWSKQTTKPAVSSYKKKEDSAWDKFSKSSKQFWSKTAEVLDPFPDPKPTPPSATSKAKPSVFSSWFKKGNDNDVNSVNDFLGQKRID